MPKSKNNTAPAPSAKDKLPQVRVGREEDYEDDDEDYQEEIDTGIPSEVTEIEVKTKDLLEEYYENEDSDEFIENLAALSPSGLESKVINSIINFSLDKKDTDRELTSVLLSRLVDSEIVTRSHIEEAIQMQLYNLQELKKDVPDSPTIFAKYIARLIGDAILDDNFIKSCETKGQYKSIISQVKTYLHSGTGRLHMIWGTGGGHKPVKVLINQMSLIIEEYLASGDHKEASKLVHELNVPHFHHEFVYLSILRALESKNNSEKLMDLFKALSDSQIVTKTQLGEGYQRVMDHINDLRLDYPNIYSDFANILVGSSERGIISQKMIDDMPSQARKRQASSTSAAS